MKDQNIAPSAVCVRYKKENTINPGLNGIVERTSVCKIKKLLNQKLYHEECLNRTSHEIVV